MSQPKNSKTSRIAALTKKNAELNNQYDILAKLANNLLSSEFKFEDEKGNSLSKRGNRLWKRKFTVKRIAKPQGDIIAKLRDAIENTPAVIKAKKVATYEAAKAAYEAAQAALEE
tara:strand:- start:82 stop:426 length:345 start_codon:yes stop_codon:yes gene_type:complete